MSEQFRGQQNLFGFELRSKNDIDLVASEEMFENVDTQQIIRDTPMSAFFLFSKPYRLT